MLTILGVTQLQARVYGQVHPRGTPSSVRGVEGSKRHDREVDGLPRPVLGRVRVIGRPLVESQREAGRSRRHPAVARPGLVPHQHRDRP